MAKGISLPVVQSGLEASIQQGVKSVGTIKIPANIDPSAFKNLAQPLGRVSGLATEFEKSIAASNARVLAFGASVGIINGVQNAFSDLLKTGIEVQKTLADISAISGRSGQELSKFGDELFNIGKLTGQSFKTAAQAALEFSRQGLSVEDTLKRTTDALTLTRFTSLNAAEAVDVLTAAANSFGETGITTAQIINKLVAVDTKFAVSAEDLANGLARAGSIAQEVGVNFDELNAAITVAQERTARGGAVIGNALKTIFTRIRSDETVQALRDIGIESLNAQGQLKGAVPLLQELAQKLQGLAGGERIQILEAVASKYNINILSALLDDLNNANSKFTQAVAISAGASNQAYERQIELNKTLAAEINRASVSVTQLFNKLSEIGVTDNLATLLKFVSDLINGFNKLVDSEGLGGNIAKGLVKGISDVFFTIGLPIIGAIFIKLTRDIAKFGVDSLKTILGINQQLKERQALEQAVVNTLIRDQQIMATILSLSGDRRKQEEYLLNVYNRQLTALQQVQNIAKSVAPALLAGGLSATSGRIQKRGASGYLPAQEAADVRRGVGGASSSSKVVSIPNFAFGGGKKGTMIANTSEYIVPNFANGGSAIFNQDMVRKYGLPSGAKKISASGGFIPNFARYVYDADRISADGNAILKSILSSKVKKNLIVGPSGAGKSTYGSGLGSFITSAADVSKASEIDILSGAARTKTGGMSKNLQQILDAVNVSGGKVSYLYTPNMNVLSRRTERIGANPMEGDLRTSKQISGTMFAPLNQFDFISKIKGTSRNFEMMRGASGYIPNFATNYNLGYVWKGQGAPNIGGKIVDTSNKTESGETLLVGNQLRMFKKDGRDLTPEEIIKLGWRQAKDEELKYFNTQKASRKKASSIGRAAMLIPSGVDEPSAFAEPQIPENKEYSSVSFPVYNLKESKLKSLKGQTASIPGYIDELQKNTENIGKILTAKLIGSTNIDDNVYKQAWKASYGAQSAVNSLSGGLFEAGVRYLTHPEGTMAKDNSNSLDFPNLSSPSGKIVRDLFSINKEYAADLKGSDSGSIRRKFASQVLKNGLAAARGYVPNFVDDMALGDAIDRELSAGLRPSQIRVTQDTKLRNAQNPNGLAVINTRDEPNGKIPSDAKIPNFAKTRKKTKKVLDKGENEFEVSSGKLGAAFAALILASNTLQSSFRNADGTISKFGEVLTTVSRVGTGASGGALLGSLGKDTFGPLLGKLGRVGAGFAKGLPFAGAVAGGILEYVQMRNEEKAAAEQTRQSEIQKSVQNKINVIQSKSLNTTEAAQEINKEREETDKKRADTEQKILLAQKRLRQFSQKINPITGKLSEEDQQEEERISESLNGLLEYRNRLIDESKFLVEGYISTMNEGLLISNRESLNARTQNAELEKRIPLEKAAADIIFKSLQAESAASIKFKKISAEKIFNASLLSEEEQKQVEYGIKKEDIENQIKNLQSEGFRSIVSQVKNNNKLASLDEDKLKSLMERLDAGKQIEDTDKALKELGFDTLAAFKSMVAPIMEQNREKKLGLETSASELEISERLESKLRLQVSIIKLRTEALQSSLQIEEEIADLIERNAQNLEDTKSRTALTDIERKIARQPFATREDEYNLGLVNAQLERTNQQLQVQRTLTQTSKGAFRDLRKSFEGEVGKIGALGEGFTNPILQNVLNTKDAEDATENYKNFSNILDELKKKRNALSEQRDQLEIDQNFGLGDPKKLSIFDNQILDIDSRIKNLQENLAKFNISLQDANLLAEEQKKQFRDIYTYQLQLLKLRKESPFKAGILEATNEIKQEVEFFNQKLGKDITLGFRDGIVGALDAAISGTENLNTALQDVARNFLRSMQSAFIQNAANNAMVGLSSAFPSIFPKIATGAKGGLVSGGSGYRDDVPALLMDGEFVMRKSAVEKYGIENLRKMNAGGIFLPGVRGGGNITGYDQLRAFANQTTTSGATDVLRGSGSSAFINLEDQSARLSRFGLLNEDTINQEIRSAQEQGLNIIAEREKYRTEQRKAFQQQLVGTIASAALSYGTSKFLSPKIPSSYGPRSDLNLGLYKNTANITSGPMAFGPFTGSMTRVPFKAYGGLMRRYAAGGPTDDIPALLMSGEYIMNRGATSKYGKRMLEAMNQGRMSRFGMAARLALFPKIHQLIMAQR